ncbi:MAG: LysR family transcriptional regulator [Eubacteriaceae bacterium]
MHIEYLEYFYKVATAKSISKVANSAHISQSALSQQISKLEDILGCKLLERSNKGVELTEKGSIVLKYVDNIVRTYDTMLEHLEMENESAQNIKIEACWSIATYSLPCVMYKVKKKFPQNSYELNANETNKIEENVMNNICDLGVIYGKPNSNKLSYQKIGVDKLVLVSSPNYKISDEIAFEELVNYPFILNDNMHVKDPIAQKMKTIGYKIEQLNILYNSDSAESVKSSVLNEYGIGFLPYISIKKDLYRKQLKLIKIKDFIIEYDMYLIYDKRVSDNKVLNDFIQYFKNIAQKSLC